MTPESATMNVLSSVQARYRQGARERVNELCCPVDYDASLLAVLPQELEDVILPQSDDVRDAIAELLRW